MRDFGPVLHGDADVRVAQRRRIVDAVTDHRNNIAGALEFLNGVGLVRRQHIGKVTGQAEPAPNRPRHDRVVARQHHAVLHSHAAQAVQHGAALRADLVRIRHNSGQLTIDRDINARIALLIEGATIVGGLAHANVALPHETLVAHVQVITVDLALHAKPDPIPRFLARRDVDRELLGLDSQCLGHGMLQLGFRRRRQPEQMTRRDMVLIGEHVENGGRAVGQGAGLVEDNGVDLGEALQVPAALDDDARARRVRHRCQHGGRRRHANAGAVVDDHQREEPVEIPRHHGRAGCQHQLRHDQPVGQPLGVVLHAGVADRRGFDETHDLSGRGVGADPGRAYRQMAIADYRRRERRVTLAARYRQAFAGDGLLVDQSLSGDDLAVDRDHAAVVDDDFVADCELAARDRDQGAVADDPCGLDLEFEQLADRAARAGRGQVADPIPELDQPGHDRARHRIALRQRRSDRERIEEIHVETALALPHPPRAQRNRIGVPKHQWQIDCPDDGIGAKRQRNRQSGQGERHAPQQRLALVEAAARALGRSIVGEIRGDHQAAELGDAHEPQAADDGAQQRLVRHVVLDDQAGAIIVDARAFDAVTRSQPLQGRFRQRPPSTEGWNVQAHAARNEMTDGQFHGVKVLTSMSRANQLLTNTGATAGPPLACGACISMTWLRANSVSVTHTGVAAAVPTSSTVNPIIPSARTILRSTQLSVATLISRSHFLKKSTTARALCEWLARNSASSSILRANWSMSVSGALASTWSWKRPWNSSCRWTS